MSNVKTTCFRFNLDNPEHARAWEYLHNIDKQSFKSSNSGLITAVNDFFDRRQRLADDPYFETRQSEDRFVEQIVSEVVKALVAEMPKFLASFMLSLNTSYTVQTVVPQTVSDTDGNADNDNYSDIDLDFIGG